MTLRASELEYRTSTFPKNRIWSIAKTPAQRCNRLATVEITVRPLNGYDLSRSDQYEAQWRQAATEILSCLRGPDNSCVIWAAGPMEWDGLPRVFPYMVRGDTAINRYHIEGVTASGTDHYLHSWISFEFDEDSFKLLMQDADIDLEYTRLYALIHNSTDIDQLLAQPFEKIGLSWVFRHNAIAVSFSSHFEGCYVAGDRDVVLLALERVQHLVDSG